MNYSQLFLLVLLIVSCKSDEEVDIVPMEDIVVMQSKVDSLTFNLGIPLFNASQGKKDLTEFNTELKWFKSGQAITLFERRYFNSNPYLICNPTGGVGSYGVRMSLFKSLFSDELLPASIGDRVTGVRFNAVGFQSSNLRVLVLDRNENIIAENEFALEDQIFQSYELDFSGNEAKQLVFFGTTEGAEDSVKFGLDDVYLKTEDRNPFRPPVDDEEFLNWLKRSSFNFFDWNYVQVSDDQGVVIESYSDIDKVSLSGIGYAYPIFILAGEDGYISQEEAKNRVASMLRWQMNQNWFDGSGGWHGIPHHYFTRSGSAFWPDISTIDWAICAAGIRVVRQYYSNDQEIVEMANELLGRTNWEATLAEEDKIAMGFDGITGEMNDFRWALAFSEETEIVYLEAIASGKLDSSILDAIVREEKSGFYPSWFGAGFTYNWLQLWTGPIEPLQSNAKTAYEIDAYSCLEKFGYPVMGLTACSTIGEFNSDGFVEWNRYISNQGGLTRLTNGSVIQISPAPYGAALGLPFTYDLSMKALREYVELGFCHEYLGLPDNVRMRDLPEDVPYLPNWDPFDINIGPLILAIEQAQRNRIRALYTSDEDIAVSLELLIRSFP